MSSGTAIHGHIAAKGASTEQGDREKARAQKEGGTAPQPHENTQQPGRLPFWEKLGLQLVRLLRYEFPWSVDSFLIPVYTSGTVVGSGAPPMDPRFVTGPAFY